MRNIGPIVASHERHCNNKKHSWELDRSVPDENFLKSAFLVVAAGKATLGLGNWGGRRPHESKAVVAYAAAVRVVPAILLLAEPLASKHQGLCRVIQKCAKLPRSKWKVFTSAPTAAGSKVHKLATLHDARVFYKAHAACHIGARRGGIFHRLHRLPGKSLMGFGVSEFRRS